MRDFVLIVKDNEEFEKEFKNQINYLKPWDRVPNQNNSVFDYNNLRIHVVPKDKLSDRLRGLKIDHFYSSVELEPLEKHEIMRRAGRIHTSFENFIKEIK